MRVVKFRGRLIDNNEWVYGYLYKLQLPTEEASLILTQDNNHLDDSLTPKYDLAFKLGVDLFIVDPSTVGQFTSLRDKIVDVGYYLGDNEWRDVHPTHWMPLPSIEEIKGNQKKTSPNSNSISIDVFEEATKGFKPYPLFSERMEKAPKSDHIADVSKKVKKGGEE